MDRLGLLIQEEEKKKNKNKNQVEMSYALLIGLTILSVRE